MKKFNINKYMYIQITDDGWEHLLKTVGQEYIDHCIKKPGYEIQINNETWYKLQCWSVFELFAPSMGGKTLFKTNVLFDDNELEECKMQEMQKIQQIILDEYKKGNIVVLGIEGFQMAPITEFIKQPADGILYDLNRIESVVLTFLPDPKWVNDYAAAQVIRVLKARVEELGEEKAIEYFQKQINAFPPPPNTFEDLCLISGLQIAIAFIKNEIPGMK